MPTPITDPTEPLQFEVTKDHVIGSVVADPKNCAGACALRSRDEIEDAKVTRSTTTVTYGDGRRERYRNPKALQVAVEGFDSSAGVFPPGVYELLPPFPSNTTEAIKKRPRTNRDGSRPYRRRTHPAHVLR